MLLIKVNFEVIYCPPPQSCSQTPTISPPTHPPCIMYEQLCGRVRSISRIWEDMIQYYLTTTSDRDVIQGSHGQQLFAKSLSQKKENPVIVVVSGVVSFWKYTFIVLVFSWSGSVRYCTIGSISLLMLLVEPIGWPVEVTQLVKIALVSSRTSFYTAMISVLLAVYSYAYVTLATTQQRL